MKRPLRSFWWISPLLIFISIHAFSQATYLWDGSANSRWDAAANWTPVRATPLSSDILIFNLGGSIIVTDVPTETVASIRVINNTALVMQSNSAVTLSISVLLDVDAGSFISFSSNGNAINVNAGGLTTMKGTITMHKGTFHSSGILTLDGAMTVVDGQYSLSTTSSLNLGSGGSAAQIQLPNNIFVAAPTIANLTINNSNGVALGSQSITVTNTLLLTSGVLTSNAAGRVILGSNAVPPIETSTSYIQGYVQQSKLVGTGAMNFMGLDIASGVDDIGNVTVIRRTGAAGVNSFNGRQSLAATWEISAASQPVSGRNLSLGWVSANDNGNTAAMRFQVYRYGSGPSWEPVGGLNALAVNIAGIRKTAVVTTREFSDWTASDETSPLPVRWLEFNGIASEHSVAMTWKTATEENTDYFEVEKLLDDNRYVTLGKRAGAGNSRVVKSYDFVDHEPSVGANYYRVKQVDVDGQFTYSKVINIPFISALKKSYSVYPVPAESFIDIQRNVKFCSGENITLYDPFGKPVYRQMLSNETVTRVENLAVPAGVYRLEISGSADEKHIQRIVVK